MKDTDRGQGVAKIRDMVEAINSRRLPLIILEMDQTGAIPDVMRAVKANYEPQPRLIPTNNTRLGVFPARRPERKTQPGTLAGLPTQRPDDVWFQGAANFPWIQDRTGSRILGEPRDALMAHAPLSAHSIKKSLTR